MNEKAKKKLPLSGFSPCELVTIAFAVIIFIVNYPMIGKCYNPFVYNDEMGYWTHAAEMAGLDWHGVSKTLAWYSFGYSFMLTPLMVFIKNTVTLYRAALVMNIIMEMISYFLMVYILRRIFPEIGKLPSSFAAAAAMLYTSYQMNAGIAFSETALLFTVTLITFVIVRVFEKPTYFNLGCLGLLCAYLFMIHNRTIGIVCSAVLVIALGALLKKLPMKKCAVFAAALCIGFIANKIIRHILETSLWPSGKAGGNDAGSVVGKVKTACSSVANIKKLLSIMASQGFAVSAATLCLTLFALLVMGKHIVLGCVDAVKAFRTKKNIAEGIDISNIMMLFIFCAFVSSWIISSVFMFDGTRIDHMLYTRYFDITVGLLIMTGICFLYKAEKHDFALMMLVPILMKLGTTRAICLVNNLQSPVFNKVCAPGICKLYEDNGQNFHSFMTYSVGLFFLLALISYLLRKKQLCIFIVSLLCINCFNDNIGSALKAIKVNQNAYAGDRELVDTVKSMPKKNVYVMPDTGAFASFLQYEMNDVRVDFAQDLDSISDGYVFANKSSVVGLRDHEILAYSDKHIIISAQKTDDSSGDIPLGFMNVFDTNYYIADEDSISTNPASNFLCFGPYIHLDADDYVFTLDMTVDDAKLDTIGYAELKSNSVSTVYAHEEITMDMLGPDGKLELDLGANVGVPVDDMEIVVFLYDPGKVSMTLESIKVNTED